MKQNQNTGITKRYLLLYLICLFFSVLIFFFSIYYYSTYSIPDSIYLVSGEEQSFDFHLPVSAEITLESSVTNPPKEIIRTASNPSKTMTMVSYSDSPKKIQVNLHHPFSVISNTTGSYSMSCKLLGIFKFKEVQVHAVSRPKIIPCGIPVGIYLETNGVLIIGTGEITSINGQICEPALNLVKSGDYIQKINGNPVSDKQDVMEEINRSHGQTVLLGIIRDSEYIEIPISPVKTDRTSYKLGIWVRDNAQGIGTLTYLSVNNEFGALGHGITDIDTGILMKLREGTLYETKILSIERGISGEPGELMGVIQYKDRFQLGNIMSNSYAGIFGIINQTSHLQDYLKKNRWEDALSLNHAVETGFYQEIHTGTAFLQCELDGEIKQYSIEITDISKDKSSYKGIEFHVTDPRLLELTGGIIQGMSGSPILQDGKVIAAVTHVFVDDPSKGYGIFIENMLEQMER